MLVAIIAIAVGALVIGLPVAAVISYLLFLRNDRAFELECAAFWRDNS